MDLANDERIREINNQIQIEKDPGKLGELVEEMCRLLDEVGSRKAVPNMPMGINAPSRHASDVSGSD